MNEWFLIEYLLETSDLLPPLQKDSVLTTDDQLAGADAMLTTHLKGRPGEKLFFLVEVKSQNTPRIVQAAIHQVRTYREKKSDPAMHPMIVVPFLSETRLRDLEDAQVSGIDLCGNGIVTIPGRLLIYRTGHKNRFPQSRPLSNPYHGRSALVGRALLARARFETLGGLHDVIRGSGIELSLSQVSKAVKALEDDLIVSSAGRQIRLTDPLRLLDHLGSEWKPPRAAKMALRLPNPLGTLSRLSTSEGLRWAVTGESSVAEYVSFGQGGPLRVAVSDLRKAYEILEGVREDVPGFADVELLETSEASYFFQNRIDHTGIRWASRIQTWIELKNGDGRQQDAAKEIKDQIIRESKQWQ